MYLDGFVNIVNVDISSVCIEKMSLLHENTPMTWKVADVTDLSEFQVRIIYNGPLESHLEPIL